MLRWTPTLVFLRSFRTLVLRSVRARLLVGHLSLAGISICVKTLFKKRKEGIDRKHEMHSQRRNAKKCVSERDKWWHAMSGQKREGLLKKSAKHSKTTLASPHSCLPLPQFATRSGFSLLASYRVVETLFLLGPVEPVRRRAEVKRNSSELNNKTWKASYKSCCGSPEFRKKGKGKVKRSYENKKGRSCC